MSKSTPQTVEILERNTVFQGFFRCETLLLRYELFDGGLSEPISREVFIRPDAAAVLLYDPHLQQVILTEQFRPGALDYDDQSPWLLETVAGIIEPDESIVSVVKRESIEEAGLPVLELVPVAACFPSPGALKEFVHIFCGKVDARDAGGIFGVAKEHENIRVHVFSCEDAFEMLEKRQINTASTVIALQWLQLHKATLDKQWIR